MFENRQELVEEILRIKAKHNTTIMESIVHICEANSIEIESVAVQIKQSHKIKEELKREAIQLKMLKDDSI